MSARQLYLTRDGSIVVMRGYKAAGIARAAGLRPTYSASAGGWMVDASRLPELVAWLEYRNYRFTLEGDEPFPPNVRSATSNNWEVTPNNWEVTSQLALEPEVGLW